MRLKYAEAEFENTSIHAYFTKGVHFYTYELRTELHLFLHHTKFAFPIVPSGLLSLCSFPKRILADQQIRIHSCPLKDLAPSETEQKKKKRKHSL